MTTSSRATQTALTAAVAVVAAMTARIVDDAAGDATDADVSAGVPADAPADVPVGAIADAIEPGAILESLVLLRWAQDQLAEAEPVLIAAARRAGVSWQALAPALGVASRQAAERRYLRAASSPSSPAGDGGPVGGGTVGGSPVGGGPVGGGPVGGSPAGGGGRSRSGAGGGTRDDRVKAERDHRAGVRAVAQWTADNTADLRRLAGQVAGLQDAPTAATADLDRLHRALADPTATALPALLAAARRHLGRHPALAGQIDEVTATTDAVLLRTQQHRDRR